MFIIKVLHHQIQQCKRRNERTSQRIKNAHGKHQQLPSIMNPKRKFRNNCLPNVRRLRLTPRRQNLINIQNQVGQPHQLQRRSNKAHRNDIIHKKGSPIGQENALKPVRLALIRQLHIPLQERRSRRQPQTR